MHNTIVCMVHGHGDSYDYGPLHAGMYGLAHGTLRPLRREGGRGVVACGLGAYAGLWLAVAESSDEYGVADVGV
jgi:hypothetical protein